MRNAQNTLKKFLNSPYKQIVKDLIGSSNKDLMDLIGKNEGPVIRIILAKLVLKIRQAGLMIEVKNKNNTK